MYFQATSLREVVSGKSNNEIILVLQYYDYKLCLLWKCWMYFQVTAVREVVSGKSNNEIILVLQYYDYDVEKAIQAYVEGNILVFFYSGDS